MSSTRARKARRHTVPAHPPHWEREHPDSDPCSGGAIVRYFAKRHPFVAVAFDHPLLEVGEMLAEGGPAAPRLGQFGSESGLGPLPGPES